jgi:hypothetical protein
MKLKKFFKNKKENLIIIFLSGQILSVRLALVLSIFVFKINKTKYDFCVY